MQNLFGDEEYGKQESGKNFADIILPVPIPRMFTYKIPIALAPQIQIGARVIVQFGRKKVLTGIIGKVHNKPPQAYDAKPILEVLDDQPTVNPIQIRFWVWMANYYCCHIGEVMHAAIPSGLRLSSESKIQANPNFDRENSSYPMDAREDMILDALENQSELSYEDCEKILGIKTIHPILKSLVAKEAVLIFEKVQEKYSPKVETRIRIVPEIAADKKALEAVFESLAGKTKQESILLKFLRDIPIFQNLKLNEKGIAKSSLMEEGDSESSLKTLIKNGVFESFKLVVNRIEEAEPEKEPAVLSESQNQALTEIKQHFKEKQTVLLHGVTGSGKTEIYIQLIRETLESGSQVLLLLPEIALTTQIVSRLQQVFGSQMGVYHSKYSDNERVEVWNGVLSGRFSFVVGVRSSIFLPFDSLGLIIVDEEHEASFKQFDPAPRFQARDSAIMLSYFHQAKTILGSATPSFESYFNATQDKYGYVQLTHRYGDASLPEYHLANLSADRKKNLLKLDSTRLMREKIQDALDKNEQVLIFQNRRGYSPYIQCEDCGWTGQCIQCDVSLTYHQFAEELRCHYCGYKEKVPSSCPACGSTQLTTMGMGTERIEESLSLLFPEARLGRMDLDTTRNKYGYQRILDEFGAGQIDILVGTQMITKGLDFGRVTVVGIWDGDRILNFPDFRAGERAFQQITQVAGRAGRRSEKGQVIIQSRNPDNEVFEKVIKGDYYEYFRHEMMERKSFYYPPYVKLVKITTRHTDFKITEKAALALHREMAHIPVKKIVLGPEKALIGRIKNQYQFESMIKLDRSSNTQAEFKTQLNQILENLQATPEFRSVRWIIDVDPN
ncbi:replication restart helicase PriA [Algoriphagus zhangzhouensis]|uniref:Replication restart protein PriA n=1 Tax=Algoriphagus zhangzhouensis TaxID=1073327 RepID=A0A1M7ZHH5_9BACT|nr:primosomal protein N' [Algoriphagus zhangzhouensis]TDY44140.1 replication restart DNA helicase PriA [Algoriphagus zhangzhouensis]SHO64282.1 replication restart DNA helicase PriA [Algoriphagus zhangzhouensis]